MNVNPKTPEGIAVWDLPLRLFHWLLVLSVAGAYITAEMGGNLIDWHGYFGVLILGLLIFRVIWGFIGSYSARFTTFLPTPARIAAFFDGRWHGIGHNPLGAISVFLLLASLLVITVTGLFANDAIAFEGSWVSLVDSSLSDSLTDWHSLVFDILTGLIALHLIAIGYYRLCKNQNLIMPMLTGKTVVENQGIKPVENTDVGLQRFFTVVLVSAALTWFIVSAVPVIFSDQKPGVSTSDSGW
jgi:cytochrome b